MPRDFGNELEIKSMVRGDMTAVVWKDNWNADKYASSSSTQYFL
jgi:hypothetical protein